MTTLPFSPTATITFVVPEPYNYVDRDLPTASWWDKYAIKAGTYPVRFTNLDGSAWNPNPNVITPGYITNIGPYYARVRLDATLIESYTESRLFTASTFNHKTKLDTPAIVHASMYAYELRPGGRFGDHKGQIHITEE